MFRNYFKTAWRTIKRNRFFSIINIIGLAVGFTCFLLICAYLYTELTYDRYAKDAEQIYRVDLHGLNSHYPDVDAAVGQGMKDAFPGVLDYTRLVNQKSEIVRYKENRFKEENMATVDANFLQLFSIPLIEGNNKTALEQPNSIVITKTFAKKYFGNQDPLGKSLIFGKNTVYHVTGVIDKVPDRSHFHFDAFISMATFPWRINSQGWTNLGYYTYLELRKNTDPKKLEAKFPQLVAAHVVPIITHEIGSITDAARRRQAKAAGQKMLNSFSFSLMPLTRIHLYSHTKYELEPNGDIRYVYIFFALALFILLLACVNYINLSTASSFSRAKETGIRKTLGSVKRQLIGQFLTESILLTLGAMILALILVSLLLPYFGNMANRHISIDEFFMGRSVVFILLLIIAVGILAGIYPAFFLSSFKALDVLKGNISFHSQGKTRLRSGLVIFQFVVSVCLIIATIIIYQQLHFMQNKKLGFNKSQLIIIRNTNTLGNNEHVFRQQLLQNPQVVNATVSMDVPGTKESVLDRTLAFPEDHAQNKAAADIPIHIFHVDNNYIPTLDIEMLIGRNFSPDFPSDSSAVIINEAAVKAMGWSHTDPIGKYIVSSNGNKFKVIGVTSDFNYLSVQQAVTPLMIMLGRNSGTIMARIKTDDIAALLTKIKSKWKSFHPITPFSYNFVDAKLAALYISEQKTGHLFLAFAIVAIVITCLGLFSLVTFIAYQRTKEIGIRKVLGAGVSNLVILLSQSFLKPVLIAIIIAMPIAWLAMNKWLQNFAYRINIGWWIFAAAGLLAIAIALITVGWQAVRAATANPVDALRSE